MKKIVAVLKNKNKKGFTLVEITVVIAVISLFVALVVSKFSNNDKSAEAREEISSQIIAYETCVTAEANPITYDLTN